MSQKRSTAVIFLETTTPQGERFIGLGRTRDEAQQALVRKVERACGLRLTKLHPDGAEFRRRAERFAEGPPDRGRGEYSCVCFGTNEDGSLRCECTPARAGAEQFSEKRGAKMARRYSSAAGGFKPGGAASRQFDDDGAEEKRARAITAVAEMNEGKLDELLDYLGLGEETDGAGQYDEGEQDGGLLRDRLPDHGRINMGEDDEDMRPRDSEEKKYREYCERNRDTLAKFGETPAGFQRIFRAASAPQRKELLTAARRQRR
jgi:hypothetical protein